MKILYDISVLGVAHKHARARTGIYRVIERVADGLMNSPDCSLTFCAGTALHDLESTLEYLVSDSQFSLVPFSSTKLTKLKIRILKSLYIVNNALRELDDGKDVQRVYLKIKRRLLNYSSRNLMGRGQPLINRTDLLSADICHTPYAPIAEFEINSRARKFVTVYDLIPILFPKFFQFNEDHLIKRLVTGITPETYVLCISESTRNDLCNYSNRVDPSNVFVTPLAASELFYPSQDLKAQSEVREKYGIPLDVRYVLSLSTLEPRKNIEQTIRAFYQLVEQEHLDDLYLVLVGTKGWDFDNIFSAIAGGAGRAREKVIVTGYVPDEDLAPLYSSAELFVYPSFYEGFGLPPLEAMQCGIPVITSNTSSLPEVVGDAGIMISPDDTDALSEAMLSIISDRSFRDDLSQKSLIRARQFSWKRCTAQTVSAYKASLGI